MYTDLPPLHVKVTEDVTTVSVPNTVNCVKGGKSDPLVVSTTRVPFGTLSLRLAEKPVAEGAAAGTVSASTGVSGYGSAVTFDANTLSGFVYLDCDAGFNTTSATVVVHVEGTSNHSFSASTGEVTVKPVDKAERLADAVVGPSAANAASTSGNLYVDVKCPVTGTAWV